MYHPLNQNWNKQNYKFYCWGCQLKPCFGRLQTMQRPLIAMLGGILLPPLLQNTDLNLNFNWIQAYVIYSVVFQFSKP